MKTNLIFSLLLVAATGLFVSGISPKNAGPHGGQVKAAGSFNIELKTQGISTLAFLLDKNCNPVNNRRMTCEIQFFFPDSTQLDVPLKPYNSDGFITDADIRLYKACRVNFNFAGRIISATFEDQHILVDQKKAY